MEQTDAALARLTDERIDEMVDGRGGVRPQWRRLLAAFSGVGHRALYERARQMGLSQPGSAFDPIPLVVTAGEFDSLARGIARRAELLERVLTDLYGPRALLREGLLPPGVVYRAPGYLRLDQNEAPGCFDQGCFDPGCFDPGCFDQGRFLFFYAADLVRAPDGGWRVLADHAGLAEGIGRLMENRRQMARLFPELFAGQDIRRLAPFIDHWQDSLRALAPREAPGAGGNPSVALLARPSRPGEARDEPVLLARELGCLLVEPRDLAARDGALWLKTVRGLRRIDVLMLGRDGWTVDPLEPGPLEPGPLEPGPRESGAPEREGSGSGVAGLLDAARAGAVRLVNHPAAGLAEAPGLAAFLPAAARRFPGEWLALPGLEDGVRGSVMPVVRRDGIVPEPVVLRMFAMFDGASWRVLPGGLARVADAEGSVLTKDVWVGAREGEGTEGVTGGFMGDGGAETAPVQALLVPVRASQGALASRAADDFFWLGHYIEQIEGAARLLRSLVSRLGTGDSSPRDLSELEMLVRIAARCGLVGEETRAGAMGRRALARAIARAAFEPGRLGFLLGEIERVAAGLEDQLTEETYDLITGDCARLRAAMRGLAFEDDFGRAVRAMRDAADGVLRFGAAVSGLVAENMVRSGGRRFMELGRRIERASTGLLWAGAVTAQDGLWQRGRMESALRLLLELFDSAITYRGLYLAVFQPAPVLDLLLVDEGNPRGVGYQCAAMARLFADLDLQEESGLAAAARGVAASLRDSVAGLLEAAREDAGKTGDGQAGPAERAAILALPGRLKEAREIVEGLSAEVSRRYFAALGAPRLVGTGQETGPRSGGEGA